ncbi:MAG TPA: four helix bundle protein [Candidatus Paceibacterota bacterium]|jgi:four helix bundle protein|nr:four helix bundle protein [Candidatus Paceibacterota bacterium]
MPQGSTSREYDLEERTAKFGEEIVKFSIRLPRTIVTDPLVSQLVRSATSIGANYMEANGASSKKDFRNKIHICKKEAQESKHWLRMLAIAVPNEADALRILWKECQELTLIFQKIIQTLKKSRLIEN